MNLFNADMTKRLADLHAACVEGATVSFERLGEFGHLPERIAVTFGPRKFVLSMPLASQVADQIEVNGFPDVAANLRRVAA